MDTFLGHSISYWTELEKMADKLEVRDYIQEIVDLKGKVSFYESRIKQMADLMGK
jgi:hypothetical protein